MHHWIHWPQIHYSDTRHSSWDIVTVTVTVNCPRSTRCFECPCLIVCLSSAGPIKCLTLNAFILHAPTFLSGSLFQAFTTLSLKKYFRHFIPYKAYIWANKMIDWYYFCCAGYCMQFMAHQLQTMGRTAHRVRPVAAALLVLHFSVHCSSQPLPVLPFNRFGTKNTYNNTCCGKQSESVDDTDFCCPPVQVLSLSADSIISFQFFLLLFPLVIFCSFS